LTAERRVSRVRDVAVVDSHVILAGYPAWLIHRLLADLPGGLETKLARTGASPEMQDTVLDAHAALGYAGGLWRREHAASTSGSEQAPETNSVVASENGWRWGLLTAREVASVLGVSDRQVRLLAARLGGQQDSGGRWLFDPAAIEVERERRAMKGAA